MVDTQSFAAKLAADFAQMRSSGSQAQQEANLLIGIVLDADPKIKLTRLLADERLKEWQQEKGVKEMHLKRALAEGRAALKALASNEEIKVPPRARRGSRLKAQVATGPGVKNEEPAAPHFSGLVPNLSLDHL